MHATAAAATSSVITMNPRNLTVELSPCVQQWSLFKMAPGCIGTLCSPVHILGLLLGTEAPVTTPNNIDFSFSFYTHAAHTHTHHNSACLQCSSLAVCMLSQEKGNNNAQWWQGQVLSTLGPERWMRVGLRQLSGMLVMVFALSSLSVRISHGHLTRSGTQLVLLTLLSIL